MDLEQIKERRRQAGLTQAALADAAGVSQSLIAKVERGRLDPSYSKAQQIFNALRSARTTSEVTAGEIMQDAVYSCNVDDTANTVIEAMQRHDISQVPVMDNAAVIGLVTESSLLHRASETSMDELTVADVMEPAPPIVQADTPESALVSLLENVPIVAVRDTTEIVGVVTKADVLKAAYG
jgi:predicted transcriptional regulator